jgi:hypothetical protein
VRHVRELELEFLQLVFDGRELLVELFDLVADALHRVDLRGRVLLVFLEGRDLLRRRVLLCLQRLAARDCAAAVGI